MANDDQRLEAPPDPTDARRRVDAALGGDAEAMHALVDELAPVIQARVARALLKRTGQARGRNLRQELEDMVQEVFAALFANGGRVLRDWDPDRGARLSGFVGLVAERKVGMLMRTGKRNPWTEDPTQHDRLVHLSGVDATTEHRFESRDLLARVGERLLARLSPKGRRYFELLYVENRDVAEVADVTETSPQALYAWRSRVHKMMRELQCELEEEGSSPDV